MQTSLKKPGTSWLEEPLRIVVMGGGTGLSALLRGLKPYAHQVVSKSGGLPGAGLHPLVDITAIVTVTDDGGSSGRLRREFEVLPPGDIRSCMVALSEDEALLSQLFQYRFATGRGLKGHSFGNLFLAALTEITGDFAHAVKLSSEVLAIAGRIFPSTAENVSVEARLSDGSRIKGETRISKSRSRIESVYLNPPHCRPLQDTLNAIAEADLISLGPGSLFTSVVPNVLVQGIPEAICNSQAVKAYFVNLMWQPGETMHFTAADHVETLIKHSGCNLVDCVVLNQRPIGDPLRKKYASQRALPVENDVDRLASMGLQIVTRDLLRESEKIRHDPEAVASVAMELAMKGRERKRFMNARSTT